MGIEEKTFKSWKIDDLIFELGLIKKRNCELLNNWLTVNPKLNDIELLIIERLLEKGNKHLFGWNEQELQTKFIAPITELVDFDNSDYYFASFAERKLEVDYQGIALKGKVDWMVAMGTREPRLPFFFIHEYKKQKGFDNDPEGQLLVTMLAAHTINQTTSKPTLFNPFPKDHKELPIYGCYIVGRIWYFVVLDKNQFCVSKGFDALDKKKLIQIVGILKKQKQMIIDRLEAARLETNKAISFKPS